MYPAAGPAEAGGRGCGAGGPQRDAALEVRVRLAHHQDPGGAQGRGAAGEMRAWVCGTVGEYDAGWLKGSLRATACVLAPRVLRCDVSSSGLPCLSQRGQSRFCARAKVAAGEETCTRRSSELINHLFLFVAKTFLSSNQYHFPQIPRTTHLRGENVRKHAHACMLANTHACEHTQDFLEQDVQYNFVRHMQTGHLQPDLHDPGDNQDDDDDDDDDCERADPEARQAELDLRRFEVLGRRLDPGLAHDFGTDGRGEYHPFATSGGCCAGGAAAPPPVVAVRPSRPPDWRPPAERQAAAPLQPPAAPCPDAAGPAFSRPALAEVLHFAPDDQQTPARVYVNWPCLAAPGVSPASLGDLVLESPPHVQSVETLQSMPTPLQRSPVSEAAMPVMPEHAF